MSNGASVACSHSLFPTLTATVRVSNRAFTRYAAPSIRVAARRIRHRTLREILIINNQEHCESGALWSRFYEHPLVHPQLPHL
jgi:hypothetical protein